jgi:hypothetical protein
MKPWKSGLALIFSSSGTIASTASFGIPFGPAMPRHAPT